MITALVAWRISKASQNFRVLIGKGAAHLGGGIGLAREGEAQLWHRSVHELPAAPNQVFKDFETRFWKPRIAPFKLTEDQAKGAFEAWHQQRVFSPSGLLQNAQGRIRAAYIPFWLFRADFKIEYSGQIGFKTAKNDVLWEEFSWREKGISSYDWTDTCMQVYGSYQYRRDLAASLKSSSLLELSRKFSAEEAQHLASHSEKLGCDIDIDPPDVKQSIAWCLACNSVRQKESLEVERILREQTGCEKTKDIQIKLKTLRRSARLVFVPAYALEYQYGEVFDAHGTRKPFLFQALVSGLVDTQIAAERHFSPVKVQVSAALGVGSIVTAAILIGLHGQEGFSLASSFLSALMICTSAGLGARLAPELIRQGAEDERIQIEEAEMEKIMSQGLGPQDILDNKHESLRDMSEWRRWEEANKWAWEGVRRRRWAEALWRRQNIRKIQLMEYAHNKARAEAKFKFEQENEARRRARFGASSQAQNPFSDGSGQRDFKGYYALLGLDGSLRATISQPDIKTAFRKAALRWHPDRLKVDSAQERERAYTQFRKVQRAYDVLRSEERRREYDGGIDPL